MITSTPSDWLGMGHSLPVEVFGHSSCQEVWKTEAEWGLQRVKDVSKISSWVSTPGI